MVVSRSEAAMALVCGGGLLLLLCLRGLLIMMADAMLRDAAASPAHGPERVLSQLRAALRVAVRVDGHWGATELVRVQKGGVC
jgi:hypothetical protein